MEIFRNTPGRTRESRQAHLAPIRLDDPGALAWWFSGENQKARLPQPYEPSDNGPARWSILAKSHAVAEPEPFALESLLDDPAAAGKVTTRGSVGLLDTDNGEGRAKRFFHDISVHSVAIDTREASGTVVARAWCETVVRRTRGFVDPSEAADLILAPARPANAAFGRRVETISFRWLKPQEV